MSNGKSVIHYDLKKVIAFQSISTGVYSFPVEQAADIAVNTVKEYVEANPRVMDLVEWALFGDKTLQVYSEALERLTVRAKSPQGLDFMRSTEN